MAQRTQIVDEGFIRYLSGLHSERDPLDADAPLQPGTTLTAAQALQLFESQATSRHLDFEARKLRALGAGYYTIGSSGHEGNAVVGALTRHTDPALLHYRSGGLFLQRATQRPEIDAVRDVLLGMVASSEDPASGGRHKVWGSAPLTVIPQTSTIASHLPRAVGVAYFIERANHFGLPLPWPRDAVVLCSFGDASTNHATALAGFNSASYIAERGLKLPLIFLCEDNGIGISMPSPRGRIRRVLGTLPGVHYVRGNGCDLVEAWNAAEEAVAHARERRKPVVLHLDTVRLFGHAGSDVETNYRTEQEIAADEARDPLLRTAELLVHTGAASAAELRERYEAIRARVAETAASVLDRPKLTTVAQVRGRHLDVIWDDAPQQLAAAADFGAARLKVFGREDALPERHGKPRHLAMLLSWAMADLAAQYPELLVFGEDVGRKGGVYHVTADLQRRVGRGRVFDTLLDETTILGLALGAGPAGFLPMPEIQYLAYIHNALDQIRGEAASQRFFSDGRYRNGMVVRVASFAYQEGFGGHFHNDNSIAALRDIPGVAIAVPSRGDDAVGMLRSCAALAKAHGQVCLFLEPIALYHQKDRLEKDDNGWCFDYPAPGHCIEPGTARVYAADERDGADVVILTYGNGVRLSLQAVAQQAKRVRVVDLRWILPLPVDTILEEARAAKQVLIVDEGRRTGGVCEPLGALLAEEAPEVRVTIEAGADTFIPLGDAWRPCLPSVDSIAAKLAAL